MSAGAQCSMWGRLGASSFSLSCLLLCNLMWVLIHAGKPGVILDFAFIFHSLSNHQVWGISFSLDYCSSWALISFCDYWKGLLLISLLLCLSFHEWMHQLINSSFFLQWWELNPGPSACEASVLLLELYPSPTFPYFLRQSLTAPFARAGLGTHGPLIFSFWVAGMVCSTMLGLVLSF
jgi:hypothetical protein